MADAIVTLLIPEQIDTAHRLGRHVRHDPRSRNFEAARCAQGRDQAAQAALRTVRPG